LEPIFCQWAILLMPLSISIIWFTTLDAPDLFAAFLAYSLVLPEHVCGVWERKGQRLRPVPSSSSARVPYIRSVFFGL
jgi:hypothetical protein